MVVSLSKVNPELDRLEPRKEYTQRRDAYRAELARQQRLEAWVGNARVLAFLTGLVLLYLVIGARAVSPFWLALPGALFIFFLVRHERIRQAIARSQRAAKYYETGLERLEDRWAGQGEPGTHFLPEDHPYALDLDVFGRGSLFERLCTAQTRRGAEVLAAWLLAPAEQGDVEERQEAVAELRGKVNLRESLATLGADVTASVDLAGLAQWGAAPPHLNARVGRVVAAVLVTTSLALLSAWAFDLLHLYPFAIALLLQSAFAWRLQRRVRQVIEPIDRRAHEMAVFAGILARIERESFSSSRLRHIHALLDARGRRPSQCIGQLVKLVNWLDCRRNPYFGMMAPLLLWTTQLAFAFEEWRAHSGPFVGRWLEAAAEFEALCSLGSYAFENPADAFAEVVGDGPLYEAEALGHPLLPESRCVRNDLRLSDDLRVLVVSGSNMSGKSTLLRTVGINAILALAGAPVRGRRLRLSRLAIGATLRIQDSLQEGRSRFYAEIRRISQLVALARGPLPLLFLLDEILHGTNSHDRRIGAAAIVRSLAGLGAIGLVTTHDLALTHIAEELGARAGNIHFEDHFENGALHFDYRIRPGVVQNSNALALMRAVGLEV